MIDIPTYRDEFKKGLDELKDNIDKIFRISFFIMTFIFVLVAIVNIFLLFKEPNYDDIIKIGERGAVFLIAMTGLVFTYAGAVPEISGKRDNIVKSGENFFNSTLNFIIGMIFLIGFRKALTNPVNTVGLPEILFALGNLVMFFFFLMGFVWVIVSGYYFVVGIMHLSKPLKDKDKSQSS